MRIDHTSGPNITHAVNPGKGGTPKVTDAPTNKDPDCVELSSLADVVEGGDPQKVEALRQAVEWGKYQVSADQLAQSVVNAHLKP